MMMTSRSHSTLYILQAVVKGYSVFYLILLPVFYSEHFITAKEIGYIGALFIIALIMGTFFVARYLHRVESKTLMEISALIASCSSCCVLIAAIFHSVPLLLLSFCITGFVVGISMAVLNAFASFLTKRGDRFKSLAYLHMLTDIVRIAFPLFISAAITFGAIDAGISLVIIASLVFLVISFQLPILPHTAHLADEDSSDQIHKNASFVSVLTLEFLDSFASSQLFVFLPLIFLAKGYSLGNSIFLQSIVFLGYMTGRWLVGSIAKKYSGTTAIGLAEICMGIVILCLLATSSIWLLYVLSYSLGIFARGTSPALKALAFDSLSDQQTKKGVAWHVVAGDSGSALGQLVFGFLIAWVGVQVPFILVVAVVTCIAFLSFTLPIKIHPA